ncbi:MAG: class B sortase [Clostridiales bacterium]|nr:class B sortase [Clostridiales bacterium]
MAKKDPSIIILSSVLSAVTVACTAFGTITLVKHSRSAPENTPDTSIQQLDTNDRSTALKGKNLFTDLSVNTAGINYPAGILDKLKPVYAVNSDVAGWLRIPNTPIDTVVVKGKDNSHYLKTDIYGKFTKYGDIFMDYRCTIDNLKRNTILFGHTTYDYQQVFAGLYNYKDPEFFKANPVIEFDTLTKEYKWKIFAVFFTSVEPKDDNGYVFNYIRPTFSDRSFSGYMNQVAQRALYSTGVDVNSSDKILTLSTCAYDFGKDIDTRMVVVARLMRDGESEEIDENQVKENPDYRRPQSWYSKKGKSNPYKNSEKWYPED